MPKGQVLSFLFKNKIKLIVALNALRPMTNEMIPRRRHLAQSQDEATRFLI